MKVKNLPVNSLNLNCAGFGQFSNTFSSSVDLFFGDLHDSKRGFVNMSNNYLHLRRYCLQDWDNRSLEVFMPKIMRMKVNTCWLLRFEFR